MSEPLLTVQDLRVTFPTPRGPRPVVDGVGFSLGRERLGIVGESGSGKSITSRAILRLVRAPGVVTAKRLAFDGVDLLALRDGAMRRMRGARIAMVMQDPKFSLNPVMRVGRQIAEAIPDGGSMSRDARRREVRSMLEAVRIADPDHVAELYPHQISGGMGQRVMIAMMLAPHPDLLIADEPTSALDASVQRQVLAILDDLVRSRGMGLILISHDLDLVSAFCDRILVMRSGRVVDECRAGALASAVHPYTRGLLAAMPRLDETRDMLPVVARETFA